ncbi:MAG: hypothetical protein ABIN36_17780 [Ferruginibacter sp.]
MNRFFHKWLAVSFFNLLLVAGLGVLMRYKIAFYLPFVQQKFLLHGHSHFAFAGWITQTLMLFLVQYLANVHNESILKKYSWLLYANLVTAYGMLVAFIFQGYAFFSIGFSTLSIIVSYIFAFYFWKDLNKLNENKISHLWFKAGLLFSVLSSFGAYGLAYMMANKISQQDWYLASVYFFLHFQYNGWFFFAGMGLLVYRLEKTGGFDKALRNAFWLFCFACIPAYFLSALWLPFPAVVYCLIIAAVIAQLIGWVLMVKTFIQSKEYLKKRFDKHGRILLLLSAIAFSIKLLLQSGSVHPALSQLSYSFRPIIIGYLHLVLLAVTSIFIIGYSISFQMIPANKKLHTGIFIFVAGIIINEILLMVQGVAALDYISFKHMAISLFTAALILFAGAATIFWSCFEKKSGMDP